MMGLSRSTVGVDDENGRHDWSMRMVDENGVGCRRCGLLSWWLDLSVLSLFFGIYLAFYVVFVSVKTVFFFTFCIV